METNQMLTLYARLEPTTDQTLLDMCPNTKRKDTVLYSDQECTKVKARIPWHHKNRPVRRQRVMLNCYMWRIVWVKEREQ